MTQKSKMKPLTKQINDALIQFDKAENWQNGYLQGWNDAMEMVHDILGDVEEQLNFKKTMF